MAVERVIRGRWIAVLKPRVPNDRFGGFGLARQITDAKSLRARALYGSAAAYGSSLSALTFLHAKF